MNIAPAARLARTGEYYFSTKLEELRALAARGIDVINLGIGSPDLPPAREVIAATAAALESETAHGYPPYRATTELRSAIAAFYAAAYRVELDPDTQLLPLLGSKEGLLHVSLAFLDPGDEVLVPDPGYPAYTSVTELVGARVRPYPLEAGARWQPDLAALSRQDLRAVKLMWVNYPHMPTGAAGSDDLFSELVAFGRRHGILICNDNPYSLLSNTSEPRSLLAFDPGMETVLELNSFSKAFNMAGWRAGVVLGHRDAIAAILQVKSNVDSGMFLAVQAGAVRALQLPASWRRERNAVYAERRGCAEALLEDLGCHCEPGQVGMFVWARAPEHVPDVERFVDELLHEAHVFVTPGGVFGTQGRRYVRASLCVPTPRLELARTRVRRCGPGSAVRRSAARAGGPA